MFFYWILLIEILSLIIFFLIIILLIKKRQKKEIIFLVIPFILFEFFIELMSIKSNKFINSPQKTSFLIGGVSVMAILLWFVFLFIAMKITDRFFSRFNLPNFFLSLNDSFIILLINLVLNPLGKNLGLWIYNKQYSYLIFGSFLGVPLWEFIGGFLGFFLFSFLYRILKNFNFKERFILTYVFVFIVLFFRFLVYNILNIF